MERWAQVGLEPGDARSIDVAAVEGAVLGFLEEVPKRPPGPAAEVEHALSVERPAFGEHAEDLGADAPADLLVQREVGAVELPHPGRELDRRIGRLHHPAQSSFVVQSSSGRTTPRHWPVNIPRDESPSSGSCTWNETASWIDT